MTTVDLLFLLRDSKALELVAEVDLAPECEDLILVDFGCVERKVCFNDQGEIFLDGEWVEDDQVFDSPVGLIRALVRGCDEAEALFS